MHGQQNMKLQRLSKFYYTFIILIKLCRALSCCVAGTGGYKSHRGGMCLSCMCGLLSDRDLSVETITPPE
jgi:hypothetical protein